MFLCLDLELYEILAREFLNKNKNKKHKIQTKPDKNKFV